MYERFAKILEERGLTAYSVAKNCNIATSTLTDWKNGRIKYPKIDKLARIADYLGVSVEYLAGTSDDQSPEKKGYYVDPESLAAAQEIFDNPDLRILFAAAKDARPEDLRLAADLLKRFKGEV